MYLLISKCWKTVEHVQRINKLEGDRVAGIVNLEEQKGTKT